MRPPHPQLAAEGYPAIGFAALATLTLGMLEYDLAALVALGLTLFCLNFFRDPERVIPYAPGLVVSPADGRVIAVDRHPDPLDGQECMRICVFMNVFNVHVNRSPVTGTVHDIRYHPGKFVNASFDKASEDNERCAVGLKDESGQRWTMVQIAGLVARRIVCRAEVGDELGRGERFGMIKFGSRVDLYLPDGYVSLVTKGDTVLAGQTVLASAGPEKSRPKA